MPPFTRLFGKLTRPPRVHFFDIKSLVGPFSPNTLRTRLSLNYKRIDYTESAISYADIKALYADLGLPATQNRGQTQSSPKYTLPVILIETVPENHESLQTTGSFLLNLALQGKLDYEASRAVCGTLPIARALDTCFPPPNWKVLFPFQQSDKQTEEVQRCITRAVGVARRLILPRVPKVLDERGRKYFVDTRTTWFGVEALDELGPKSETEATQLWVEMTRELESITNMLSKGKGGGPFINGDVPSYPDFIVVAFLAWFQRVDEQASERLLEFGNGELQRLWHACKPWLSGQGEVIEWDVESS
ncbi:hypothetical protein H2204_000145 [Knufia peltigerae]|uniref:Glutathione S-transferase UstS-like C-terminal domain-containing protein n=1 Tax=Knufia peltigerae TaxID=1002370 RepID=A0AA38YG63_9EURO|nr:hypothetical protein H2204_000145 [Knufia peltigerae]